MHFYEIAAIKDQICATSCRSISPAVFIDFQTPILIVPLITYLEVVTEIHACKCNQN